MNKKTLSTRAIAYVALFRVYKKLVEIRYLTNVPAKADC